MTERPILYNASMTRAILERRKTKTRRIVKRRKDGELPLDFYDGLFWFADGDAFEMDSPYGKPGDRLWVRETFYAYGFWTKHYSGEKGRDVWHFNDKALGGNYRHERPADTLRRSVGAIGWFKRPAIFMPRLASRITLEITDVRVERLIDISEEDAIAEGIHKFTGVHSLYGCDPKGTPGSLVGGTAREAYALLWESLYGAGSWDANPWVWNVSFEMVAV